MLPKVFNVRVEHLGNKVLDSLYPFVLRCIHRYKSSIQYWVLKCWVVDSVFQFAITSLNSSIWSSIFQIRSPIQNLLWHLWHGNIFDSRSFVGLSLMFFNLSALFHHLESSVWWRVGFFRPPSLKCSHCLPVSSFGVGRVINPQLGRGSSIPRSIAL